MEDVAARLGEGVDAGGVMSRRRDAEVCYGAVIRDGLSGGVVANKE